MTNRHVVFNLGQELVPVLKANFGAIYSAILEKLYSDRQELLAYRSDIISQLVVNDALLGLIDYRVLEIQETIDGVESLKAELSEITIQITPKIISTEVLLKDQTSDTKDENFDTDYLAARVLKISEEEEVDLAIIQLNTRTTPTNIKKIFDLSEIEKKRKRYKPKKGPKIKESLYMIGYNRGKQLSDYKNGATPQLTSGEVLQERGDRKILYSINALEGSSGSPVIDSRGNLVAVNFAKVINSQNFNFGIPLEQVLAFYSEN